MSTKTTFKRVALVAVASMGFGMLSIVAANATQTTAATYDSIVTNTTDTGASTAPIPAGTAMTANLRLSTTGVRAVATLGGDTATMTFTVTNSEATNITSTCTFAKATANATTVTSISTPTAAGLFTVVLGDTATLAGNGAALTNSVIGTVSCPTSTGSGDYTITPTGSLESFNTVAAVITPTLTAVTAAVSGTHVTQGTTRGATGAATTGNSAKMAVNFPTHTGSEVYTIKSSGVGAIVGTVNVTGSSTNISGVATDFSAGLTYTNTASTAAASATLSLTSAAAGTQTITVSSIASQTGLATVLYTSTVTWGAASVVSAGNTTAWISQTLSTPTASDTYGIYGVKTVGTQAATILVTVKDNANVAMTGRTIIATISGTGNVSAGSTATGVSLGYGVKSGLASSGVLAGSTVYINVWGSGVAGVGTVTISDSDQVTGAVTVLATKTVNFYGSTATLESAARFSVIKSGTNSAAFTVKAKDSNGTLVVGAVLSGKSSNSSAIITGWTCAARSALADNPYPGQYRCTTAGFVASQWGDVSPVFVDDQATPIASNAATVTVGTTTITGMTMKLDKASYMPGEKAVLTITLTGAHEIADTTDNVSAAYALGTISSNFATGGVALTEPGTFGANSPGAATSGSGVATIDFYAPAVSGTWNIDYAITSVTQGLALYGTTVTASATVGGGASDASSAAAADAAAEATDAANAATDAANAAAEAADAATAAAQDASDAVAALSVMVAEMIASLKAQLTALTNLVIKIQKKIKA